MIRASSVAAVFRFEIRRSLTWRRMLWWIALVAFPILLSSIARLEFDSGPPITTTRIAVSAVDEQGELTLDTGMGVVRGSEANDFLRQIGEPFVQDGDRRFQAGQKSGPRGRRGRRRPRWQPSVLVLELPPGIPSDAPRLNRIRSELSSAFNAVLFQSAGAPPINVRQSLRSRGEPAESTIGTPSESDVPSQERVVWALGLFLLLPVVVSMMGVFLWATPAIASELEGRSWAYIATRPNGPVNVLLGKYLVGVVWGMSAALVSLVGCLSVANVPDGSWSLFPTLATLIVLGCPAYGAVYALIGAIMPRRAMVIAVAYSLTFEGLISFLPVFFGDPALVSRVTVSYPLRALLTKWVRLDEVVDADITRWAVSNSLDWVDISSIIGIAVLALGAAVLVLRNQELSQADESDS